MAREQLGRVGRLRVDTGKISAKYGGGLQSGIVASGRTPNVMIFTDPEEATENGYNFDGWVEDEIFQYTGEGQSG